MLGKIRKSDVKKVLWFLIIVIVPAFVFWGANYFVREKSNYIGKIYEKKISLPDFETLLHNTQALFLLSLGQDALSRMKADELKRYVLRELLFMEKAKKEKITVSDKEVLDYIKNLPFLNLQKGSLKERYLTILKNLRIVPGQFEEFLKDVIRAQKLRERILKDVSVSEEEIRQRYIMVNQKVKANYIFIEFEKIKNTILPQEGEIEKFYEENKEKFRQPPQVKIAYILLGDSEKKLSETIEKRLKKQSLKDIAKNLNLKMVETDYFSSEEPIKELGWQKELALKAFQLKKEESAGPIPLEDGVVFFTKIDEKPSSIPELSRIKEEVKTKYKEEKAYQKAREIALNLINEIKEKGIKNLKEVPLPAGGELKETGYFKRGDFLENIGLDMNFKNTVFSLEEGQIYLEPLEVKKGFCIVQLLDKEEIDEKKFKEENNDYYNLILEEKINQTLNNYIVELIRESKLTLYKF